MATKSGRGKQRGHGDGALYYSEARGRWIGILDLGFDATGKRKRRKFTGKTRADVQTKMREARRELDEGRELGSARDTVAALLRDFYDYGLPATCKTDNTRVGYSWAINNHLIPAIGARKLRDLTPDDVDQMLQAKADSAALDAKGNAKLGMSRASLAHIHQVLKRALRWAERRGRVSRNVAALVDTPDGGRRSARAFTIADARAFLEEARGDRLEAAWTVMLMLGTRPGETFALSWSAIDWEAGVIEIKASLRRDQATNSVTVAETKTSRSRRRLDAPKLVLDALRRRRRDQAAERLVAGAAWSDTGLIFTNEVGGPLDPSAVRRRFKRLARDAGLGDRHPHECRHSLASMLSAQGVPLEQISDVLGHDGSRTTEQVYRHVITPSIASGKAPIEAIFEPGSNPKSESG